MLIWASVRIVSIKVHFIIANIQIHIIQETISLNMHIKQHSLYDVVYNKHFDNSI